jgi:hypothetical protein
MQTLLSGLRKSTLTVGGRLVWGLTGILLMASGLLSGEAVLVVLGQVSLVGLILLRLRP